MPVYLIIVISAIVAFVAAAVVREYASSRDTRVVVGFIVGAMAFVVSGGVLAAYDLHRSTVTRHDLLIVSMTYGLEDGVKVTFNDGSSSEYCHQRHSENIFALRPGDRVHVDVRTRYDGSSKIIDVVRPGGRPQ